MVTRTLGFRIDTFGLQTRGDLWSGYGVEGFKIRSVLTHLSLAGCGIGGSQFDPSLER